MRDYKLGTVPESKGSKERLNRPKIKGFGYQVLGFGAGGRTVTPFIEATGGTIVTNGDFKSHIFTGPGTFCVSNEGNACGSNLVDYMIVAAGGGGAGEDEGGGGGAGGYRESHCATTSGPYTASPLAAPNSPSTGSLSISPGPYSIVIGAGGAVAGTPGPSNPVADNGNPSTFSSSLYN